MQGGTEVHHINIYIKKSSWDSMCGPVVASTLTTQSVVWNGLHALKLCYFLALNQIEAEAFSLGETNFWEQLILTEGRKQLLATGCFKQ